jgi:hypothetical protein
MSDLFPGILDPNRKTVFEKLAAFKGEGVLGGGTAIALKINHRHSYDFDLFIGKDVDEALIKFVD